MRVAGGVRRTDLDQLDLAAADVDVEPAVERAGRQLELDAVEVELAEEAAEQLADFARRLVQRRQHRRWDIGHLVGRRRRGDDLGGRPTTGDLAASGAPRSPSSTSRRPASKGSTRRGSTARRASSW